MAAPQFSTGSIVKYGLLPRVFPRFSGLFLSGFGHIAFLMAQVYAAVRLLPASHPYLNPANNGRYNIRQVIAAAAGHLKFRRENIDQIIVFFALLLGMILLVAQAVLLLASLFMPAAMAGALSFGYYFGSPTYGGAGSAQDLAFILLDRIFGVPGIFNSCVNTDLVTGPGVPCYGSLADLSFDTTNPIYTPTAFPWPYHEGLHAMLQFYSVGLLVVAAFIILYFVIVIVAETAQTGTPFGKRFNSVWAPLRLVMALGLLIPITYGLNSAQYITLYMARFGSNFASNGWLVFNAGVTAWGAPQAFSMVAKPQTPPVDPLLQFMMLAHTCKALEEGYMPVGRVNSSSPPSNCTGISQSDDGYAGGTPPDGSEKFIDAYLVKFDLTGSNDARLLSQTDSSQARTFFDNGDMVISFGDRACDNTGKLGRVLPLCGEIVIPMVNPSNAPSEAGSAQMQMDYYELVRWLWGEYNTGGSSTVQYRRYEFCNSADLNSRFLTGFQGDMEIRRKALAFVQKAICDTSASADLKYYGPPGTYNAAALPLPTEDWYANIVQHYREGAGATTANYPVPVGANTAYPGAQIYSGFPNGTFPASFSDLIAENIVRTGLMAQIEAIANGNYEMNEDALMRGWAGAGMWYNHIARINGGLTGAALNYPEPSRFPQIMEAVLSKVRMNNQHVTPDEQFNPNFGGDSALILEGGPVESHAAQILNNVYVSWRGSRDLHKPYTGNALLDFINALFGTKGLITIDDPQNQTASPLALLSSMGKSLVEASIRNIVGGVGLMGGGAILKFAGIEASEDAISGLLFAIATATLTAGIVLYYVLPFLPFIYFFFAVGNWVKGIFEAMVGVPLWALAHIRIDGNGLPGEAAMNGYYMLFEIFLRPILILFGLLASVTIFSAMATVLNGLWPIATKNLTGTNFDQAASTGWVQSARGPVDQLFFTVMYAVILYIMALSSFKLIDLIPNQIMRWLGTGVSTFSDMAGDPAASLTQYTSIVGQQMSTQAIGGIRNVGAGMKSAAEAVKNMGSGPKA